MTYSPEIEKALSLFATEQGVDRDEAISRILRDWLLNEGYLFSGEEGMPPQQLNSSNDG